MAKITQTAGRNALGTFAPEFAHFNDDVLFGENWNNEDIDLKTRILCRLAKRLGSVQPCKKGLERGRNRGITWQNCSSRKVRTKHRRVCR